MRLDILVKVVDWIKVRTGDSGYKNCLEEGRLFETLSLRAKVLSEKKCKNILIVEEHEGFSNILHLPTLSVLYKKSFQRKTS